MLYRILFCSLAMCFLLAASKLEKHYDFIDSIESLIAPLEAVDGTQAQALSKAQKQYHQLYVQQRGKGKAVSQEKKQLKGQVKALLRQYPNVKKQHKLYWETRRVANKIVISLLDKERTFTDILSYLQDEQDIALFTNYYHVVLAQYKRAKDSRRQKPKEWKKALNTYNLQTILVKRLVHKLLNDQPEAAASIMSVEQKFFIFF